jgi:hypothetical protein
VVDVDTTGAGVLRQAITMLKKRGVTFAVSLDGSEPFIYEWAFGSGAVPSSSAEIATNVEPEM